jgi:hypothetical protein
LVHSRSIKIQILALKALYPGVTARLVVVKSGGVDTVLLNQGVTARLVVESGKIPDPPLTFRRFTPGATGLNKRTQMVFQDSSSPCG